METEPSNAEPPKCKRRWFQFSLRTLLIVVTLLAVVCGYVAREAETVRVRKATFNRMKEGRGIFLPFDKNSPQKPSPISWIRRLLGDEVIREIILSRDTKIETRSEVRAEFPEATIRRFGINPITDEMQLSDFPDKT